MKMLAHCARAAGTARSRAHRRSSSSAAIASISRCATTFAPTSILAAARMAAAGPQTVYSGGRLTARRRDFSSTSARRKEPPSEPVTYSQPAQAATTTTTTTEPAVPPTDQTQQEQQKQQQQSRRRTRRRILFGAAFLLLGSSLGSIVRTALAPPDLPAPGTDKDRYLVASIAEKARNLPLYRQLEGDEAWRGWDAYEDLQTTENTNTNNDTTTTTRSGPSLTSSTLSGSRALAYQHIFHNPATNEIVSIIYLGASIAGWPGVVHGGAIATVLDETLARCAIRMFPSKTGVTANLEMDYKAPTRTEGFYVVRVRPVLEEGEVLDGGGGVAGKAGGKADRKRWVTGSLERLDGTVCVKAKALFVVPKGVKLAPITDRY